VPLLFDKTFREFAVLRFKFHVLTCTVSKEWEAGFLI